MTTIPFGIGFYLGGGSSASLNNPPTDIELTNLVGTGMTVPEATAPGTPIFTISGTDPDVGDVLTFSEVTDVDNKFTVSGTQVILFAGLNQLTAATHDITIRATDTGGLTYDEIFTIFVEEADDILTVSQHFVEVIYWNKAPTVRASQNFAELIYLTDGDKQV